MAVVQVAEWMPDAAALGNPGSLTIKNAVPGVTSYKPIGSHNPITDAVDARPRGAVNAFDKDKNIFNYVGGETKLYRLIAKEWTDTSKSGGYSTGLEEIWEFARWKNQILATNYNDHPQTIEMGAPQFSDLTTDFRCRRIAVIRDHVVVANTFDSTDGAVPDRIRWSGFNDETDYTVSPTTGSDVRDLKSGGGIQKVVGGDYGVILSERNTWRMIYDGAPTWFRIDEVLPGVGAVSPGLVAQLGATVFYLSNHGFVALTNASQIDWIGAGKVDQFVLNDIDQSYLHRCSSTVDPEGGRVAFAYPDSTATSGRPNKIVIFDRQINKWSLIEMDVELLWRASSVGMTLEELDDVSMSVDTLPESLDSSLWKGGAARFGAFDADYKHGFFDGSTMTATIDTREMEINAGRKTLLNGFRPLVDGGTVRAMVGSRDRLTDSVEWSAFLNLRSSGRCTTRANARYHRFRLELSGDWQDAIGVSVERQDARRAGMR